MFGDERYEQLAQGVGIDVDVGDTVDIGKKDLPVPDHVGDDESDEHDSGHRHDPFLADRRSIEVNRPGGLLLFSGGGHDLTL